ncbi:MAG: FmdE family protein [Nitrospinaceae bacterium]
MNDSKEIIIADDGKLLTLSYQSLLDYHGGGAVFGATVGFRALQAASKLLSQSETWERKKIKLVSRHPGPGVKDAIEFVTRCVTRGGFQLLAEETVCNSKMKFVWQVSDGRQSVTIQLKDDFLPGRFFDLLDRIVSGKETPEDREEFNELKELLSRSLWEKPLEELFETNCSES